MPDVKALLDDSVFQTVIDSAPLVSIDLVVRNSEGLVLLGQRLNRPAQGFWFVPGGRIHKGESLATAFRRLTQTELGIELDIHSASYLGLYEHFYDDSIYGGSVSTHYVVSGFEVVLPENNMLEFETRLPQDQHDAYQWMAESELMDSDTVHIHSKWYFEKDQGFL